MPHVRLEHPEPAIAVLVLDRPERRNALSIALRDEVTALLAGLATDPELKVVVITGAGDVFSAGFDLGEFEAAFADADLATRLWESSDRFHHALLAFPLATIAAVNGPAVAGGFDLALCCDLRVASSGARFSHPEYTFGDVVYAPLHDLVGGALARELTMTGAELTAEEAVALHLVTRAVDPGELMPTALQLARDVARAPRHQLMRTKAKAISRTGIDPATTTLDL